MLRLLKRAGNLCNRRVGLSLARTYLYRIVKPGKPAAVETGAHLSWETLSPARVQSLSEIGLFDAAEGLQRLTRGDLCYVAYWEGRAAHYSWVQRSGVHPITEAGMSVPVATAEFWIYHCVTAEWARGKGIYPATLARITGDHLQAGYRMAWIYTVRENIASQKGILRAGFGLVTTLDALRVGSRYFRLRGRAIQGQ